MLSALVLDSLVKEAATVEEILKAYGFDVASVLWKAGRTSDAEEFLRLVQGHGITTTRVVPIMLNRIVNLPAEVRNPHDTSSIYKTL